MPLPDQAAAAPLCAGLRGRVNVELLALVGLILARTLVFTVLKWLRFRSFFAIEYQDSAAAHQLIWHTAHLRLFYQNMTGEYFLGHFEPIYLVPALAYAIVSHPITIFAVVSLGFSLGALPVYLWVKRQTQVRYAALGCAVAYLLYAPLNYVNLGDVRGVVFCVAPLLFALYFFELRRPWAFVVSAVLAMACKENVAFVIFLMGPLALLRRRRWPWVVGPSVLGAAWFVVALKVVMPRILSGHTYSTNTYFNHWGGEGSALDLALTILGDPINHARLALSESRLILARLWLAPLCFLALLAPDVLFLGIPGFMQIALLRSAYFHHIRAHWFTIPSVLMFAAGAYGLVRALRPDHFVGRRLAKVRVLPWALAWAMAGMCLLSNLLGNMLTHPRPNEPIYDTRFAQVNNMFDPVFYRVDDEDRRLWRIVGLVPRDASLAATAHLLPALAERDTVMEMWTSIRDINDQPLRYTDCDYLLIDLHNYHHGGGWYRWPRGDEMEGKLCRLLVAGGWRVILREKTTLLLKKDVGHFIPSDAAQALAKMLMDEWQRVQVPMVHVERATRAFETGDLNKASEEYLEAIKTPRPDPYPYGQLCGISLRLADWAGAVVYGEMAVRINPREAFTWYRLGLAYMELGRDPEAIGRCKRSLALFPHDASSRALLAELYQRTGCRRAARRQARIALKIKFDDPHANSVAKALGVKR